MEDLHVCGNIFSTSNYNYFVLKCFKCNTEFEQWTSFVFHLEQKHLCLKHGTKSKTELVLVLPDKEVDFQNLNFIKEEEEEVADCAVAASDIINQTEHSIKKQNREDSTCEDKADVRGKPSVHTCNRKLTKSLQEFNFNLNDATLKEASFLFLQLLEEQRVLWDSKRPGLPREKNKALKEIQEQIYKLGWTATEANLRRTTSRILRQCQQAKEDLAGHNELDNETKYLYNLCPFLHENTDDNVFQSNMVNETDPDADVATVEKSQSTLMDLVSNGKFKNGGYFKRIRFYVPGNVLATELINNYRESPVLWDTKRKDFNNLLDRKEIIGSWIPLFKQRHGLEFNYDDLSYNLQTLRKYVTLLQNRKGLDEAAVSILEQCSFLPQPSPRTAIKCEHCGKNSQTTQTHQAHLYGVHKIGECPYKCPHCNKDFCNASQRDIHVKVVHTKELDFPCPSCELRFVSRCYLDLHLMVHLGVKNFICETCGKRFRRRVELNNHERRIHLRQRNFSCTMCPKAFYTKALLRDHVNAHLDIRNYKCPTCEKAFHSAHSLMRHKQIHAIVKKYACKLCDARFHQFVGLNAHMKNRHKFVSAVVSSECDPDETSVEELHPIKKISENI